MSARIGAGRSLVFVGLAILLGLGLVYKLVTPPEREPPDTPDAGIQTPLAELPEPEPTIVFIVLDMVRWDHTSMCGYHRPTTPTLVRLKRNAAFSSTCRAYTPGTWTLPSHASYFTGEEVPTHGADCLLEPEDKESVSLWGDPVRPLAKGFPTLAELLSKRGYDTVMVSGNPVVSKWSSTGLDRGFETVVASKQFGDMYGDDLTTGLIKALDSRSAPDKPLFLFVNIADAHHPWLQVPEGLGWVPARPFLDNRPRIPTNEYPRFLKGEMDEDEKKAFLTHAVDSYDWAVRRADDTLAQVMSILKKRNLLSGPRRIVITSDHGEFLGEHNLLSHGIFTYEPNTRVPLLFHTNTGPKAVFESGPMSALTSFDLALNGSLPDSSRPARAAGYPDGIMSRLFGDRMNYTTAAAWVSSTEKLLYRNGDVHLIDLEADPGEKSPAVLPENHADRPAFRDFTAAVRETGAKTAAPSKEMVEALRKLGYVE